MDVVEHIVPAHHEIYFEFDLKDLLRTSSMLACVALPELGPCGVKA